MINHCLAEMTSSYTPIHLINWLLPGLLLIMGDANVYQRFFSVNISQILFTLLGGVEAQDVSRRINKRGISFGRTVKYLLAVFSNILSIILTY